MIENPTCKKCNQLVRDENNQPTQRCVLKGHIENIDTFWCSCFNAHWLFTGKKEEIKND